MHPYANMPMVSPYENAPMVSPYASNLPIMPVATAACHPVAPARDISDYVLVLFILLVIILRIPIC